MNDLEDTVHAQTEGFIRETSEERSAAPTDVAHEPERGSSIGRYLVLGKLGEGAMGVVFAAHDPELDRTVALKLLHTENRDTRARARLVGEAQALGRLNHTNVVAVHDVGVHRGSVFIAMEHVIGTTLATWGAEHLAAHGRPLPWRAVTRVFEAAAQGLAAAHREGLVHRDFKPANVMLGEDGRVRVMDFGLAQVERGGASEVRPDDAHDAAPPPEGATLNDAATLPAARRSALTHDGALVGTPAYMAPELFSGRASTAKSDQFALCVAFYEFLYGERPFQGLSLPELVTAIVSGERRPPPRRIAAPRWLRRVVLRGLEVEPERRFPSVEALLAAIAEGRARERRRALLVPAIAVLLIVGAVLGLRKVEQAERERGCRLEAESIRELWSEEVATSTRESVLATGLPYAEAVAERLAPAIERRVEAWSEAAAEACRAATIDRRWSPQLYDKATWCLEQRRHELAALIDALAHADPASVQDSLTAIARLAPAQACVQESVLAANRTPPARALRPVLTGHHATIVEARRRATAGDYTGALEDIRRVRDRGERLGWAPLQAAAQAELAHLHHVNGHYERAERAGVAAFTGALRLQSWTVAYSVSAELAEIIGVRQSRHREGEHWAAIAEAVLDIVGDGAGVLAADLSLVRGHIARSADAYDAAEAHYMTALTLSESLYGPEHPALAESLDAVGSALAGQGRYAEALEFHGRSIDLLREGLAESHPAVADGLCAKASVHFDLSELDRAERLYDEALAIYRGALGPQHPRIAEALNALGEIARRRDDLDEAAQRLGEALAIGLSLRGDTRIELANTHINLGLIARARGEYDLARDHYTRGLEVHRALFGEDSLGAAVVYTNLGSLDFFQGDLEGARALFLRARAIQERLLGPDHPRLSTTLNNLGKVAERLGAPEEARHHYRRALAIGAANVDGDSPALAYIVANIAGVDAKLGRYGEAIRGYERAYAAHSRPDGTASLRARAGFRLAALLWDAPPGEGRDRPRAESLVRSAHATLVALERSDQSDLIREIERWMAARHLQERIPGE